MITLRFKYTFRERIPEWITSIALIVWGMILLGETPALWDMQYFSALSNIASQKTWASITIIAGVFRVIALGINGAWRPTAHMRAIGALMGALVWAAIIISYLTLNWNPPAIAAKGALLALDISGLWFASGDAKLADIKASELNGVKHPKIA